MSSSPPLPLYGVRDSSMLSYRRHRELHLAFEAYVKLGEGEEEEAL